MVRCNCKTKPKVPNYSIRNLFILSYSNSGYLNQSYICRFSFTVILAKSTSSLSTFGDIIWFRKFHLNESVIKLFLGRACTIFISTLCS